MTFQAHTLHHLLAQYEVAILAYIIIAVPYQLLPFVQIILISKYCCSIDVALQFNPLFIVFSQNFDLTVTDEVFGHANCLSNNEPMVLIYDSFTLKLNGKQSFICKHYALHLFNSNIDWDSSTNSAVSRLQYSCDNFSPPSDSISIKISTIVVPRFLIRNAQ